MQQYIIRRMLLNGVVLLLVATMVFAALRVDSDQVVNRFAAGCFHQGEDTQQCKDVAKNLLGLDESIPKQYVDFMKNTLTLDFGKTFSEKKPVLHEITSRAAPSIELGLLQIVVALLVGIPVGVISAIRQDSWVDYILRFVAIFFLGIPVFIIAIAIISITTKFAEGSVLADWLGPHNTGWVEIWENPYQNLKLVTGAALVGGLGTGAII